MNVQEYIKSGIIESYVLGIATDSEREEFESMEALYPEIKEARIAFEKTLEDQLLRDAKEPPAELKTKVLGSLKNYNTDSYQTEEYEHEHTPVRKIGVWKWMAAASLILLAGAAYLAFTTYQENKRLVAENRQLQQEVSVATARMDSIYQDAQRLYSPAMKMTTLTGTATAPKAYATVYWDTTSKDVYLMINNLPKPASDKQYQLWALLDGKPVDLGVFDFDIRERRLLVKAKNIQNAQAFAISLEPKGGSPQDGPTGQVYVMGNL